jgi:pantoate kinase
MSLFREIEVWVPHRISGFFQIEDTPENRNTGQYSHIGSRGGGPALSAFGKTHISLIDSNKKREKSEYRIFINGEDRTMDAKTTLSVINQFDPLIKVPIELEIHHNFDLPIGCGYGSSGAGALGTALGINVLLDLGLSELEVGRIAHIAEVINHTGLGTIGGQLYGGLSLSIEPGFPFKMDFIPYLPDTRIVTGSWGPISKKSILTNPEYKKRIIEAGRNAMTKMLQKYTLSQFMDLCREFIKHTRLLEGLNLLHLQKLMDTLNTMEIYGASMNQIGQSIFCICSKTDVENVFEVFKQFNPTHTLQVLEICPHGPLITNVKKN